MRVVKVKAVVRNPYSLRGRTARVAWILAFFPNVVACASLLQFPPYGPLLAVPLCLSALAATCRRLHDIGQSGKIQLIPIGVAAVVAAIHAILREVAPEVLTIGMSPMEWISAALVLGLFAAAIIFIWIGCTPGDAGPNRYGEPVD